MSVLKDANSEHCDFFAEPFVRNALFGTLSFLEIAPVCTRSYIHEKTMVFGEVYDFIRKYMKKTRTLHILYVD